MNYLPRMATIIFFLAGVLLFAQKEEIIPLADDQPQKSTLSSDTLYTDNSDSLYVSDSGDSTAVIDSVLYSADSLYYFNKDELIELKGNATLKYETAEIKSDRIALDLKNDRAFSSGDTWMKDGDQLLAGNEVKYDIDSKNGLITEGISKFEKGFFYGKEIRKVDSRVFDVDEGRFTTCDAKNPHFHIYAKQMRIFRNDKIVAKPVLFYVNNFPIMGLPFGTFTIKRGRHSGILVPEPGYNRYDGKYLKNIAYYFAYKDYSDLLIAYDFKEKSGWEVRLENVYIKRYKYSGYVKTRLKKRVEGINASSYDWVVNAKHHSDFEDKSTFDANLNFASTKKVWENSVDIDERLKEEISSDLSYKRLLWSRQLNISASYTDNFKDKIRNISFPKISYSLPSKPIYELFLSKDSSVSKENNWWKNFNFNFSIHLAHKGEIKERKPTFSDVFFESTQDSSGVYINQHNAGAKNSFGVNYSHKFGGWLNISPGLSANEVWYDRDKLDNKLVRAADYSSYIRANFSLYGLRQFNHSYLKAVRHIITPEASFNYRPDFSKNENKYYSFDGISVASGRKSRSVNLALNNKWSLKIRNKSDISTSTDSTTTDNNETAKPEDPHKRINDILTLRSSLLYDLEKEDKPFSNINHSVGFNPAPIEDFFNFKYSATGNLQQDAYNFEFLSWRVNNEFSISGQATYVDYFPVETNKFGEEKNIFPDIQSDSLKTDDYERTSIKDIEDNLARANKSNWSIVFSHSYSASRENKRPDQQLDTTVTLQITKNMNITYSNYLDLTNKRFIRQSFTLSRDIHCWKITLNWNKSGDIWDYRLLFFNIKLPDSLRIRKSENN